ncbi:hypothetical protein ILUMI_22927 [Ignelater luminosus]|uniref:Uncharacterized protein n=1 Tax=Ignelater luminosus TaxID=2038154 RepID=A0A8K0G253_IGNLU|nr:hypothetical protein ILUMI_22927 [Ignelater luminosus]
MLSQQFEITVASENYSGGLDIKRDRENRKIFSTEDDNTDIRLPYLETVGSLIFVPTISRPDILFAVETVSYFLNNSNTIYVNVINKNFRYVHESFNLGILYGCEGLYLEGKAVVALSAAEAK